LFPCLPMRKRKIHIIIAAGLFGFLAWISVNLREQYVVTVNAPFFLQDVPDGWAVKSRVPQSMQLKFRGDGWQLAGVVMGGEPKLVFSVNTLPPGNRPLSLVDVADRLTIAPGIQLLDVKPESVRVELDRVAHKRLPVVLDAAASFREGYGQVGSTSISPESVTVTGAESVVRALDAWSTERRVFENLKTSVDATVPLAPPGGHLLTFSSSSVRVSITVEPFAEKVFNGVTVDVMDVPANREVILIPPKIELVVRAGIRQLSAIGPVDFRVTVTYARITADSTGAVDTDIMAPEGVQVVTKRPDHVQYIVRKRL